MSKDTQVHPLVAVLVVAGAIAFFVWWVGIEFEPRRNVISQSPTAAAPAIRLARIETGRRNFSLRDSIPSEIGSLIAPLHVGKCSELPSPEAIVSYVLKAREILRNDFGVAVGPIRILRELNAAIPDGTRRDCAETMAVLIVLIGKSPPAAPEIHTAAPETKPDPERVITRPASPQPDPEEVITRLASALKIPDKTLTAVRSDLQLKEPSCSLLFPEVMGCEVRYGTSSLLACRAAALLLAVRKAADYRWARALAMSTNCSGNWVELDLHIEPSPWVRIMQVMPDRREPVFSGDYGKPSGGSPRL